MIRLLLIAVAALFLLGAAPPPENALPAAPFAQAPAEVVAITQAEAMISAAVPHACGCASAQPVDLVVLFALLALRTICERLLTGHHH